MKKCWLSLFALGIALAGSDCCAKDGEKVAENKKLESKEDENKVDLNKIDQTANATASTNTDVESISSVSIIKVGNETINVKDFLSKVGGMFAQSKDADKVSAKDKETFYRSMVYGRLVETLFYNSAKQVGLDKDPIMKEQIDMMKNQILARAYMQKILADRITEQSLKEEYNEYKKGFPKPGIEIGTITVADKATAEKVIKELNAGRKFADLAKQYSTAPSKDNGGSEGLVPVEGLPANLKPLSELKPGEHLKEPIHTPAGFHIIAVLSKQIVEAKPFNEIRSVLEGIAQRKQIASVAKSLIETGNVVAHDANGRTVDIVTMLDPVNLEKQAKERMKEAKTVPAEEEVKEQKSESTVKSISENSAAKEEKKNHKEVKRGSKEEAGFFDKIKNIFS